MDQNHSSDLLKHADWWAPPTVSHSVNPGCLRIIISNKFPNDADVAAVPGAHFENLGSMTLEAFNFLIAYTLKLQPQLLKKGENHHSSEDWHDN